MLLNKNVTYDVENLVARGATYLDAIITVAETLNVDVEDVVPKLSPVLIEKLKVECISNKLVDGTTPLSLETL